MLTAGDKVTGFTYGTITLNGELGSGTQGTVFKATSESGEQVAVKWYVEARQHDVGFRTNIENLVNRAAPSAAFLWPLDIVTKGSEYGYVMGILPPSFASIPQLLKVNVPVGFHELILACLRTVHAFSELHAVGLSYRDISSGNLFVDPSEGRILICDNDNAGSSAIPSTVNGTQRFMAPEIVRGEARPSAITDLHSMAVLLFLLLYNDHPLLGLIESQIHVFDIPAQQKVFGLEPLFIFDPADASNRPVVGIHDNALTYWSLMPPSLNDLFTQAFTVGLREPGHRPTFRQWRQTLSAAADALVRCPCGKITFVREQGVRPTCWKCKQAIPTPARLDLGPGRPVVLRAEARLYAHHLNPNRLDDGDRSSPVAELVKHPTEARYGLRNLSADQWWVSPRSGGAMVVEPGRSVSLEPDIEVNFGAVTGRILAAVR